MINKIKAWIQDQRVDSQIQKELTIERLSISKQHIKLFSGIISLLVLVLTFQHIYIPGVIKLGTLWWIYLGILIILLMVTLLSGILSWRFLEHLSIKTQQAIIFMTGLLIIISTTAISLLDISHGEDTSAYVVGLFILVAGFRFTRIQTTSIIGGSTFVMLVVPLFFGIDIPDYYHQSIVIYSLLALWMGWSLESQRTNNLELRVELAQKNVELEKKSYIDSLTGVYNRRAFFEHITILTEQCKRYHTDLSIAIVDIDKFKKVNDTLGHAVGDQVLKIIVDHIKIITRTCDITARYGGEEFILAMSNTHLKSAMIVLERLRKEIEGLIIPGVDWPITISIGVAIYNPSKEKFEETLIRADQAMYQSKSSGGNYISVSRLFGEMETSE